MKVCAEDPRSRTEEAMEWLRSEGIDPIGYVECIEKLGPNRVAVEFLADAEGHPTRIAEAVDLVDAGTRVRTVVVEREVSSLPPFMKRHRPANKRRLPVNK